MIAEHVNHWVTDKDGRIYRCECGVTFRVSKGRTDSKDDLDAWVDRHIAANHDAEWKEAVNRMSIKVLREASGIRIRVDREGERAVSALLSEEDVAKVLAELAGATGYTITPTGTTGDTEQSG